MIYYLSTLMFFLAVYFTTKLMNYTNLINISNDTSVYQTFISVSAFFLWMMIIWFWLVFPIVVLKDRIKQLEFRNEQEPENEKLAAKIRYFLQKELNDEFYIYTSFDLPELLNYLELNDIKFALTNNDVINKTLLIIYDEDDWVYYIDYDVSWEFQDQKIATLNKIIMCLWIFSDNTK